MGGLVDCDEICEGFRGLFGKTGGEVVSESVGLFSLLKPGNDLCF